MSTQLSSAGNNLFAHEPMLAMDLYGRRASYLMMRADDEDDEQC